MPIFYDFGAGDEEEEVRAGMKRPGEAGRGVSESKWSRFEDDEGLAGGGEDMDERRYRDRLVRAGYGVQTPSVGSGVSVGSRGVATLRSRSGLSETSTAALKDVSGPSGITVTRSGTNQATNGGDMVINPQIFSHIEAPTIYEAPWLTPDDIRGMTLAPRGTPLFALNLPVSTGSQVSRMATLAGVNAFCVAEAVAYYMAHRASYRPKFMHTFTVMTEGCAHISDIAAGGTLYDNMRTYTHFARSYFAVGGNGSVATRMMTTGAAFTSAGADAALHLARGAQVVELMRACAPLEVAVRPLFVAAVGAPAVTYAAALAAAVGGAHAAAMVAYNVACTEIAAFVGGIVAADVHAALIGAAPNLSAEIVRLHVIFCLRMVIERVRGMGCTAAEIVILENALVALIAAAVATAGLAGGNLAVCNAALAVVKTGSTGAGPVPGAFHAAAGVYYATRDTLIPEARVRAKYRLAGAMDMETLSEKHAEGDRCFSLTSGGKHTSITGVFRGAICGSLLGFFVARVPMHAVLKPYGSRGVDALAKFGGADDYGVWQFFPVAMHKSATLLASRAYRRATREGAFFIPFALATQQGLGSADTSTTKPEEEMEKFIVSCVRGNRALPGIMSDVMPTFTSRREVIICAHAR